MQISLGFLVCLVTLAVVSSSNPKQISSRQDNTKSAHQINRRATGSLLRNLAKRSDFNILSNNLPSNDYDEQASRLMDEFVWYLTLKETGMLDKCFGAR